MITAGKRGSLCRKPAMDRPMVSSRQKDFVVKRRIASTARVLLGLRNSAAAGAALRVAAGDMMRTQSLAISRRRRRRAGPDI